MASSALASRLCFVSGVGGVGCCPCPSLHAQDGTNFAKEFHSGGLLQMNATCHLATGWEAMEAKHGRAGIKYLVSQLGGSLKRDGISLHGVSGLPPRRTGSDYKAGHALGLLGSTEVVCVQNLLLMDELQFAPLGNHCKPLIVLVFLLFCCVVFSEVSHHCRVS